MKAPRALVVALIVILGYGLSQLSSASSTPSPRPAGPAPAQDSSNNQDSLRPNTRPPRYVQLAAQNGSGITGQVSLNTSRENPNTTDVFVGFNQPAPNTSYFAGMYFGTCSSPGEMAYPLNKVENGRSDSTLPYVYYELFIDKNGDAYRGPYAILVSRTADKKTAIACGDLPGPGKAPVQKVEPIPDKSSSPKPQSSEGQDAQAINLVGRNGNTVVAKAWFSATGPNKTRVTVKLSQPSPNGKYSANIVLGVCEDPSTEAFKLGAFQRDTSNTDLPVIFSKFTQPDDANRQPYAIMLYQGAGTGGPHLACGSFTGGR
jgi:hypothetical protein